MIFLRRPQPVESPPRFTRETITALTTDPTTKRSRPPCMHCGAYHAVACPRIKAIEWHPGGNSVAKVEYWERWPTERVLFPEDIPPPDEVEEPDA